MVGVDRFLWSIGGVGFRAIPFFQRGLHQLPCLLAQGSYTQSLCRLNEPISPDANNP